MNIYKEIVIDALTGEEVIKPYSAEQIAEANAGVIEAAKLKEAQEKTEADKAALLSKLGITADEAKLLLG